MGRWVSAAILFIFIFVAGCQTGGGSTAVDLGDRQGRLSIGKLRFAAIKKPLKTPLARGKLSSLHGELDPQTIGLAFIRGRVEVPEMGFSREGSTPYSTGGSLVFDQVPVGEAHVTVEGLDELGQTLVSGSIGVNVAEDSVTPVNSLVLLAGSAADRLGELFIQDIALVDQTSDSVTFHWVTPIESTSFIVIEGEDGQTFRADSANQPATNHLATVSGLTLNTHYVARITARAGDKTITSDPIPFFFELSGTSGFSIALAGGGHHVSTRDVFLILEGPGADGVILTLADDDGLIDGARKSFASEMNFQLPDEEGIYTIRARFFQGSTLLGMATLTVTYIDEDFGLVAISTNFITENFAEVAWATNFPTTYSEVRFGEEGSFDRVAYGYNGGYFSAKISPLAPSPKTTLPNVPQKGTRGDLIISELEPIFDYAILPDLDPGVTYNYRVIVHGPLGEVVESDVQFFSTPTPQISFGPFYASSFGYPVNDMRAQFSDVSGLRYSPDGTILFIAGTIGGSGVLQAFDYNGRYLDTVASDSNYVPTGLGSGIFNGTTPVIAACTGISNKVKFFEAYPPFTQLGSEINTADTPFDIAQHPETYNWHVVQDNGGVSPFPVAAYASLTLAALPNLVALTNEVGLAIEFTSPTGYNPPEASMAIGLGNAGNPPAIARLVSSGTQAVYHNHAGQVARGMAMDGQNFNPPKLLTIGASAIEFIDPVSMFMSSSLSMFSGNPHGPFTPNLKDLAIVNDRIAVADNAVAGNPAATGTVILANGALNYLRTVAFPVGKNPTHYGPLGPGATTFDYPNQSLYVVDRRAGNDRIKVFDVNDPDTIKGIITGFNNGVYGTLTALTICPATYEAIYVLTLGGYVYKFAPNSLIPSAMSGSSLCNGARDLAHISEDGIYIVSTTNSQIIKAHPDSFALLETYGSLGTGNGQFNSPEGIAAAFTPAGLRFLVADTGNHRIQVFDESFQYLTQFGTHGSASPLEFEYPKKVVHDAGSHLVFVFDSLDRLQILSGFNQAVTVLGPSNGVAPLNNLRAIHVSYGYDPTVGLHRLFLTDDNGVREIRY